MRRLIACAIAFAAAVPLVLWMSSKLDDPVAAVMIILIAGVTVVSIGRLNSRGLTCR
jgi:hypothetical protein